MCVCFYRNADECISPNTAANFFSTHIILLFTRKTVQSKLVLTNEKKSYNLKFPLNLIPILVHITFLLSLLLLCVAFIFISFSPLSMVTCSVTFTIKYSPAAAAAAAHTYVHCTFQVNIFCLFFLSYESVVVL